MIGRISWTHFNSIIHIIAPYAQFCWRTGQFVYVFLYSDEKGRPSATERDRPILYKRKNKNGEVPKQQTTSAY